MEAPKNRLIWVLVEYVWNVRGLWLFRRMEDEGWDWRMDDAGWGVEDADAGCTIVEGGWRITDG